MSLLTFPEDAKYIIASCNADVGGVLDVVTFSSIIDELNINHDKIEESKLYVNKMIGNVFSLPNTYINLQGLERPTIEVAICTDFIPFDKKSPIKVKGRNNSGTNLLSFYDINGKYISGYGGDNSLTTIVVEPADFPIDAVSVRATGTVGAENILECGIVLGNSEQISRLGDRINTFKGDYFSIKGSYIRQQTGIETVFEGVRCTPFIRINPDAVIKVKGRSNNATALIAFYDKDKNHISSIFGSENNDVLKTINPVNIPTGALYIRCSVTEGFNGVLETEIVSGILEELQIRQPSEEPVASSGSYVNVTELYPIVGYHTKSSARSAIPLAERYSGIVLSYAISEKQLD